MWLVENAEHHRKWKRHWVREIRQKAIQALGGVCVLCGYADIRALQVDHIIPLRNVLRIVRMKQAFSWQSYGERQIMCSFYVQIVTLLRLTMKPLLSEHCTHEPERTLSRPTLPPNRKERSVGLAVPIQNRPPARRWWAKSPAGASYTCPGVAMIA